MAIDRLGVVTRHNITITDFDPLAPLSVGNGEFAFTADLTGLQSLPSAYRRGIPLGTQAQWGFHTSANPHGFTLPQTYSYHKNRRGSFPYPAVLSGDAGPLSAATWLRENPHRLQLGCIGFVYREDSALTHQRVDPNLITDTRQTLDLASGVITSEFRIGTRPVSVVTLCHPDIDAVAVRVTSPLLTDGRLAVRIMFPYLPGMETGAQYDPRVGDGAAPSTSALHKTIVAHTPSRTYFERILDDDRYYVAFDSAQAHQLRDTKLAHTYDIAFEGASTAEFCAAFSAKPIVEELPAFDVSIAASASAWRRFWHSGAAIDLSGSTDERAHELERRIVLSEYLTRIQCCGSLPPQETGLVMNSWYGRFHLEMHWWHAAQFPMWGRPELLERSLPWYETILPAARETARRQGCTGARWPKCPSLEGREMPSSIGPFLLWQQPHPIYYAELLYRQQPVRETLDKFSLIVAETAEFMGSFAIETDGRFVLGPPSIPAQESYRPDDTINPTYELAYWWWGLETAQTWRERQGLVRRADWDDVLARLSRPLVIDGLYAAVESAPHTVRHDHPSLLMALGFLPSTPLIDAEIMNRTYNDVLNNWKWQSTWGWDYPVLAMTATRLGRLDDAFDALLMNAPKNRYLPNGHNFQVDDTLPLYLPGNGGILAAVAMMAGSGLKSSAKWRLRAEDFPAQI
ncbi:MAG: hypothetical protein P4L33_05320 [Capsulimonadaceae bacterium]|nr:hypothetical protein [Capsulimonadaceae bacterium]